MRSGLNNAYAFADSLIPAAPGGLSGPLSPCPSLRNLSRLFDPLSIHVLYSERANEQTTYDGISGNNRDGGEGSYARCRVQLPHSRTEKFKEILITLISPNYNLRKVLIERYAVTIISAITSVHIVRDARNGVTFARLQMTRCAKRVL